mgnify:FL=1
MNVSDKSRSWLVKLLGLWLSLSLLAAGVAGVASVQAAQGEAIHNAWITQAVDAPALFAYMTDRSIRLDSANHPHIVFGGDHLYYGYHDGTSWSLQTVDPANGVGMFASITLDAADRPHIAYYDALNGALKYAYWNGTAWTIQTLDQPTTTLQTTAGVIPDRHTDGRIWRSPEVESLAAITSPEDLTPLSELTGYGLYTSIAIDTAGNIHVSYYDSINLDLKYARTLLGSWQKQTVASTGDVGQYSSLAVNSLGHARISYYDLTNGDLRCAYYNGTSWADETVDSTGDAGR